MLRTTIAGLRAGRRRLLGASLAIIVGVGFLAATLVMGDTLDASFGAVFAQSNAGTDVVVRNATVIGSGDDVQRDRLDGSVQTMIEAVPGVAAAVPEISGTAQLVGSDGKPIGGQGPPTFAGNWVTDADLNPYRISEGRAPRAENEVVIDAASAETGKLSVGSTTTVRTPDPVDVTVVGIARFGPRSSAGGSTFVGFTAPQASSLFGDPGEVSDVIVRGDGSRSPQVLRDEIARALPGDVEAITGSQLTAEQLDDANGDFLGFVSTFLLAFAVVALVVATFSIHNTFSILVAQRNRESALLRALGASRRQVLASVAGEALAIGAAASVVGLGVGIGLGLVLKALLGTFGLDLEGSKLQVSGGSLAVAFAVGLVVTVVASVVPAIRASRVAPTEALRSSEAESVDLSTWRTVIGAIIGFGGAGIVVLASQRTEGAVTVAGLGALAVLVATVLLGPALARPAAALIGGPIARLRGQPGKLARLNAMRNPRRTAGSALALVIGTVVVALFATLGSSIRHSIDQTVNQSFGGDLVVSSDGFSGAEVSPQVAPALARLPEVDRSVGLGSATVTVNGTDEYPTVADPAAVASLFDLDVQRGSMGDLKPGQLAVSERYADENHLSVGDAVPMTFVDGDTTALRVGAVYRSAELFGNQIMTPEDWAPHDRQPGAVAVAIGLRPGTSLAEGRQAVEAVTGTLGSPTVQDRDQYVAAVAGPVDQLLTLVYGLLGLAVLIALLGIANTLSLAIHERRRELGLLRAVGLTRAGLRSAVRWESVITALLGTVLGISVGTFLGWGLTRAIAGQEGFVSFQLPTTTLVVVLVLAATSGIVAAVRPAHRAGRLDVLGAIAGR